MESIKFGNTAYELVANGYRIADDGGKIIFKPGSAVFDAVEAELRSMQAITMLDSAGEPSLTRSDLVYSGRLAKDDNYVIGIDTGTGADIMGPVMIAEFRVPDLSDKVAELEAKIEYMSMMSGIEMEV